MSEIQRYDLNHSGYNSYSMERHNSGDYVMYDDHAAEIETLRAQLTASADEQNRLNAVAHDQFMQLVAKDAELAQCRQDAERYRWLRRQNWIDEYIMEVRHIHDEIPETMDIAIDAAISQSTQQPEQQ